MKSIRLPYTPSITHERIMEILRREYPNNKISKFFNQVRIKQNAMRVAQVVVIHNQRKNLTQISISATTPFWVGGTILIPILFIIFTSYSLLGNWATEITEKLNNQLQKPNEIVKPKIKSETVTRDLPSEKPQRVETTKKVSFAKFGNGNSGN